MDDTRIAKNDIVAIRATVLSKRSATTVVILWSKMHKDQGDTMYYSILT